MPATKNSAIDAARARWRAGSDSTRCASGGAANGDDDSGEEDSDTMTLIKRNARTHAAPFGFVRFYRTAYDPAGRWPFGR
ncbi:hypothetical protein BCCH1_31180 [Burkholderia contaminans]|uniref:Uncharacterized protein n=1 Tax=Burkholderia contaminans TaxID=488447 RepID=A0A250L804_9BURK|nr:hypothetical protein BCCH1_31180 [Burkholderia contaminans]GLZ73407.1 hypothetical protein Bcon01_64520 [Burkholderia contaminans]